MAFVSLEIFFFRKRKKLLNFTSFLFFVGLLLGVINERSHNALSVFKEGAREHILRTKVRPYGFENVLWQNLTDFLFVVNVLIVTAWKLNADSSLFPSLETLVLVNLCDILVDFQWFSLLWNCFKKISEFFKLTVFVLYCRQALLWTGPIIFMAN